MTFDNIQQPSISEEASSDEESHRSVKTNETDTSNTLACTKV